MAAETLKELLTQSVAELQMVKVFIHEAGTDPDAWLDIVIARLRDYLALGERQETAEPPLNYETSKLCYVSGSWAYFTTQPLELQTGDDWNDAPYEHNAGSPYEWGKHDGKRGRAKWSIYRVAWDGPFETPEAMFTNSPWCVDQINTGATPWLKNRYDGCSIMAGVTLAEFRELIHSADGQVFEALRLAAHREGPATADETRSTIDAALSIARRAANSWACFASRKTEYVEIARLHSEIDGLSAHREGPADELDKLADDVGEVVFTPRQMDVILRDWTPKKAYTDEVFPAHDFKPLRPGEHPHCSRCGVPKGSTEAGWLEGKCTKRTWWSVTQQRASLNPSAHREGRPPAAEK